MQDGRPCLQGRTAQPEAWPAEALPMFLFPPGFFSLAQKRHFCYPTHEGRGLELSGETGLM